MQSPNIAVSFLKSPTPICYWIRNTEVNRYCCIFRKINNIFFRSSFWGIFFLQYKHVSVMFRHSSWPISIKKIVDPACSSNNIWVKTDSNNKWWPNGDQKNTHDFLSVHLYIFFFCTVYQGLGFYYFYYFFSITGWSAAPQTTLRGGPGPGFEPGTGDLEAGTLTTRLH